MICLITVLFCCNKMFTSYKITQEIVTRLIDLLKTKVSNQIKSSNFCCSNCKIVLILFFQSKEGEDDEYSYEDEGKVETASNKEKDGDRLVGGRISKTRLVQCLANLTN